MIMYVPVGKLCSLASRKIAALRHTQICDYTIYPARSAEKGKAILSSIIKGCKSRGLGYAFHIQCLDTVNHLHCKL